MSGVSQSSASQVPGVLVSCFPGDEHNGRIRCPLGAKRLYHLNCDRVCPGDVMTVSAGQMMLGGNWQEVIHQSPATGPPQSPQTYTPPLLQARHFSPSPVWRSHPPRLLYVDSDCVSVVDVAGDIFRTDDVR